MYDFSMIKDETLEFARHRGSMVHLACELFDRGTLDDESVDPRIRPYLDAWIAFCRDLNPAWITEFMERPMFHTSLSYGGTPDRVGVIGDKVCLIDIKTTSVISPVAGIQLAGYKMLLDHEHRVSVDRCGVVQLANSGNYKLSWFDEHEHESAFYALRTIRNWEGRFLK